MKTHITLLLLSVFVLTQSISIAQEGTKIPFDNGVLKLCSSKNFIIKGYDGKEVVIKNLSTGTEGRIVRGYLSRAVSGNVVTGTNQGIIRKSNRTPVVGYTPRASIGGKTDSTLVSFFPRGQDKERSAGLKKLGKKAAAAESGIYLVIEKTGNELIIKDDVENMFIMNSNEKYEIMIPNSISLNWNTGECKTKSLLYFNSNTSEVKNFKGEVEISSALNNLNLLDVSGPVSINTIGGNVTVNFDKTTPNELYSIYSNNGYIDITLPNTSNILVDATAAEILSDLDFTVVSENEKNGAQKMSLKLNAGKVKMKLDADLGNIYLRKQ